MAEIPTDLAVDMLYLPVAVEVVAEIGECMRKVAVALTVGVEWNILNTI
jgi:hypothetical protein